MDSRTIESPYISVEVKAQALEKFAEGLMAVLKSRGLECEFASSHAHVSIAYTDGAISLDQVEGAASEIAGEEFSVNVNGFDLFEGRETPYDYLALNLDMQGAVINAIEAVEDRVETKPFPHGYRGHISLLKFNKGVLDQATAQELIRELNASQKAASAIGKRITMKGEHVCVYNRSRECILRKGFDDAG